MTLDLGALSAQIDAMARHESGKTTNDRQRVELALATLQRHAARWRELGAEVESRRHCPPAARPVDSFDQTVPAPSSLESYVALATDGSQIEPDRHAPVYCHLINVGRVRLHYGAEPSATLDSRSYLAYRDEDLYLRAGNRWVPIEGHLLAMKRHVYETRELLSLCEHTRGPVVALQDGTLTLSAIEGRGLESQLQADLLGEFLMSLDALRERRVPIAAYVSLPRATEVVNLLRVAECPYRSDECDRRCSDPWLSPTAGCQVLAGIPDRALFNSLLGTPGERSTFFVSPWPTSLQRYGAHRVYFFYMNVGSEVARVEVPQWVAEDTELATLVHAAILDQVRRGQGFPRALVEAHEQAVVRLADRRVFWELVARQFTGHRLQTPGSEKQQSKRVLFWHAPCIVLSRTAQPLRGGPPMRCPRCNSDRTNLNWLREQTIVYWCTPCHAPFEVDRTLVQSTARPVETRPGGSNATGNGNRSAKAKSSAR